MAPPQRKATKKRGRWDDSSEDEDDHDDDDLNQAATTKKTGKTGSSSSSSAPGPAATSVGRGTSAAAKSKARVTDNDDDDDDDSPTHNPLLDGCRSVYDTYERIEKISEGTYGIVWKARDLSTSTITGNSQSKDEDDNNSNNSNNKNNSGERNVVALKQIKFDSTVEQQQGFPVTALREINVLMALYGHPNIVSVKEMVVGSSSKHQIYMVMEYFDLDLHQAMEKRIYPNVLQQGELKGILQQTLQGMAYMHSKYFMHRGT